MPGSKPKVGHNVLSPSYTAPNPTYAPLLPSYYPPLQPTHTVPSPTYVTRPAYAAPTPSNVAPKPDYVAPKPYIVNTKPGHVAQKIDYVPPKPNSAAAFPPYVASRPSYPEPKPAYANAIPTYTVASIQPTIIEHHTHSHTHVYQEEGGHQDVYHGQGSHQVFHRQDLNQDVSLGISHGKNDGSVQLGNHQDSASANDQSQTVVSTQFISDNFQPGKIETGFQPLVSVSQPLFRPLAPTYREDCHCVPKPFCSDQDIVARNAPSDIRELLDARNGGSNTLSNDTESESSTAISESEVTTENSVRRGRVLGLTDQRVRVTEEIEEVTESVTEEESTEAVTEASTVDGEETRVRREADESEAGSHPSDRQGVSRPPVTFSSSMSFNYILSIML